MQNLPVIFAIDRAGLVGSDGETHQGAYDISYLNHIPNMTILAPKNRWEFADMMEFASSHNGPIAIRYPRGAAYEGLQNYRQSIALGKSEMIYEESDIAIFAVGHMMETAEKVRENLKKKGFNCSLVNSRFVKPMDTDLLDKLAQNHKVFITIEEAIITGGYGETVANYVSRTNPEIKVLVNGIPDSYVEHGDVASLRKSIQLDADSITEKAESAWEKLS